MSRLLYYSLFVGDTPAGTCRLHSVRFSVGIMWPGTISICSAKIPSGGTAMFALLAMAGDMGGALGPAVVGNISQNAGDNMQRVCLQAVYFRLCLLFPFSL